MIIRKEDVVSACKLIAPKYNLEPNLIIAICLIEGEKDKANSFDPSVARLEQNFYRKYTKPQNFATTTEILLAASYGVMQMMGQSLLEVKYFEWFFNSRDPVTKYSLGNSMSEIAVPKAINFYCVSLETMIEFGCKHFSNKLKLAGGNITKALGFWNGDLTGKYAESVQKIIKNLPKL